MNVNTRFYLRLFFIIIYIGMGWLLERFQEKASLDFMQLPPIKDLWLPIHLLYLLCRTQTLLIYLFCKTAPYALGLYTIRFLCGYTINRILFNASPMIQQIVMHDYFQPILVSCQSP